MLFLSATSLPHRPEIVECVLTMLMLMMLIGKTTDTDLYHRFNVRSNCSVHIFCWQYAPQIPVVDDVSCSTLCPLCIRFLVTCCVFFFSFTHAHILTHGLHLSLSEYHRRASRLRSAGRSLFVPHSRLDLGITYIRVFWCV